MKKLCTALILCLVSIMAQGQLELIGAYTSCDYQFQIYATDPQNGNFIVLINTNGAQLAIESENLAHFKDTLLLVRDKYVDWKETAEENNISEIKKEFPYTFPKMLVGWWTKSEELEVVEDIYFTPKFYVHEGKCSMAINKDVTSPKNETQRIVWLLCSVEEFDKILSYLDAETINRLYQARNLLK